MTKYCPSTDSCITRVPIQVLLIPLVMLVLTMTAAAQSAPGRNGQSTIVIDPGHGGQDAGAAGLSGTTEKEFALNVGQKLAVELGKHYQVVLTRRDNSELLSTDRTAVANHHQADIFVSLHCSANFSRQPSGYNVYFHRPPDYSTMQRSSAFPKDKISGNQPIQWHSAQSAYQRSSERLAERICRQFRRQDPAADCHIYGLPVQILEGAAMPAVMIELGYLTNPSDEKKMQSPRYQNRIVKTISEAIRGFLDTVASR